MNSDDEDEWAALGFEAPGAVHQEVVQCTRHRALLPIPASSDESEDDASAATASTAAAVAAAAASKVCDANSESDDDEETEAIVRLVDQVFEELGLKLAEGMRALPCVYITQSRRGQPCSNEIVVGVAT